MNHMQKVREKLHVNGTIDNQLHVERDQSTEAGSCLWSEKTWALYLKRETGLKGKCIGFALFFNWIFLGGAEGQDWKTVVVSSRFRKNPFYKGVCELS